MKKIVLLFAITGVLFSCSKDDDNNNQVIVPATSNPSGIYVMTAFNTTVPTDLNDDGISSINQFNETNCFNGNAVTIYSDNTFTATSRGVEIGFNGTTSTIDCFEDPTVSGTWALNGTTMTFTYTDGGSSFSDDYNFDGASLVYLIQDGDAVGTEAGTGEPVYVTTDIQIIYTKQN